MYRVKANQRRNAKAVGVVIRPSSSPNKKLDVYKDGFFVTAIGDIHYKDFADYLAEEQKGTANPGEALRRRDNYYARHEQNIRVIRSPGWYAWKILWQ